MVENLTWTERFTWARMNRWFNRLPLRGRVLFFSAGMFVGGGGLSGASLRLRAKAAAQPPDNEPDMLQHIPTPFSGELARWVWWPYPHWKTVYAELLEVPRPLLLLGPFNQSNDRKRLVVENVEKTESERRSIAIPMSGASLKREYSTDSTAGGDTSLSDTVVLTTAAGDCETLRVPSQEWIDALETASTHSAGTGGQVRKQVPRRVMHVSFPKNWSAPFEQFRIVKLHRKSEEYRRVADLAIKQQCPKSLSGTRVKGRIKVKGVSRVQSPKIWDEYCMRRSIIAAENDGNPNEKWLWHGTTSVETVLKKGLDPRVCSLDGMFGGGVYFADLSTKSVFYAGAQKKGDTGQLLLCRVSLGRQMVKYASANGIRRPPEPHPLFPSQTQAWWNGWHFHSLFAPCDPVWSSLLMNEYIVYHSNQGVPEYVVDFELV